MIIKPLEEERLLAAAHIAFPNSYIQIESSDIYLKNQIAGRYHAPWLDHDFYVSTEYAYEDRVVNGNKTRYKVAMPCILVKADQYDVIYDSSNCYYVAYEEEGEIKFRLYVDLIQELPKTMELLEELIPV